MRLTYDPRGNCRLRASGGPHPGQGEVILDYDGTGRLLGIEVLGADRVLRPEVLAAAERP